MLLSKKKATPKGTVSRVASSNGLSMVSPFHLIRSIAMVRVFAVACTLLAFLFLVQTGTEGAANQKPQMVKGTIKDVQTDKNVLIVNQKVKNEFVERELSIETTTEFIVMKGTAK